MSGLGTGYSAKELAWHGAQAAKKKAGVKKAPMGKRRKTAIDHTNEKSHLYYVGKLNELKSLANYYKGLWEGGSGAYWQGRYEQLVDHWKDHGISCLGENPDKKHMFRNTPGLPSALKPMEAPEWTKSKIMGPLNEPIQSFTAWCANERAIAGSTALYGLDDEEEEEEDYEEG